MKNRFGVDVRRGLCVKAYHPRGGTISGIIVRFERFGPYGWRAVLNDGRNVGRDDVYQSWPVRLLRTRIEVGTGKPGYRWTMGYYIVGPDCKKQYPPVQRAAAYASARQQWPHCVIQVKDDE